MINYLIRRLMYAVPILIGVNLLTFCLFFVVTSPKDIARAHLGEKHVTMEAINNWIQEKGYDKPLLINLKASKLDIITETIFFQKSVKLFVFDFGLSDQGRNIRTDIIKRMGPSLSIAVPTFFIGITVNICVALLVLVFRGGWVDKLAVISFVSLMSISYLFYIIAGQYFFAGLWHLVPISGFNSGWESWRFILLPILIGVFHGIGSGARWYRTIFLDGFDQEYVQTAKSKGATEIRVLFKHVLPNSLLPILTGVVVVIPSLFMGSLIMESFFSIPGLGSYMLDAIQAHDFAIVRAVVFIGSALYVLGLILTDISYTWADPRVRLN